MSHCLAKRFLTALLLTSVLHVSAQTSTVSNPLTGRENNPYTKFGIGELQNGNNTVLRGMGNITSAYESPVQVNTDNPASYSFLTRTTFEAGATISTRSVNGTVDGNGVTYQTGTGTLSYLNIAFPIRKKGGICLGFRPYSQVYYKLADTITAATGSPIGQAIKVYTGDGALNYAFIGGSAKIKNLSVGFNVGYLFGNIRNTTAVVPIDPLATNNAYTADYSNYTKVGGIQWKGGAMYVAKLDSDYTLHIGGTISISQNVTEHFSPFQVSTYSFGDTTVRDTVYNPGTLKGSLTLPLSYSLGIMLSRNDKWSLGLDFAASNWSSFHSTPDTLMNHYINNFAYKVALGGEYTPDMNNIRNYFSRVTYRLGVYYGTEYLKFANTELPYYGLTLGASLPFRRSLSHIHFAIDAGSLGTTSNNLTKQNYFRFTVGMSFNDLWFVKRKFQ